MGGKWSRDVPGFRHYGYAPTAGNAAAVQRYFTRYPGQAKQAAKADGYLPLHCAALNLRGEHAVAIVKLLLKTYPEGAAQKNSGGDLPLHLAAVGQKGEHGAAIVTLLLEAFPAGAMQTDTYGDLPLHFAAFHQKGEHGATIVALLLHAFPDAVRQRDNDGCLPLHDAAYNQTGERGAPMVAFLLEAYPEGAKLKNKKGELPADYAERNAKLPASCLAMLRAAAKGTWTRQTAVVTQAAKPKVVTTRNVETTPAAAIVRSVSSQAFPSLAVGHFANISSTSIGSGTHKTVFSATYTGPTTSTLQSGSDVALLYFKQGITPNLHEYKVMTDIRAQHLAKFYGSVQSSVADDTLLCLVSDLAPFGSLPHFFEQLEENEARLSLSHKLAIAKQAGDGLSALHVHGLVHADVAARNVLVYAFDPDNHHRTHVKLSDYGMVRERSDYDCVTIGVAAGAADSAAPVGDPLPLSPKWASWESLTKDKFYYASDVWSFAVLVWETLTECNKPYPGVAHTISAMIVHLAQGHRLPQPDGCSAALWSVMSQCWREKRTERPRLADVLAQVALGLEEAAAAATAAKLSVVQAKMHAMQLAQEAWLKTGYGWRASGIALSADLDRELTYIQRGSIVCADPRAVGSGPLADALADAIEELVVARGGSQGDRFRANVDAITLCKNQRLITRFNECLWLQHAQQQEHQGTARFKSDWCDSTVLSGAALQDKRAVFARLQRLFVETDVAPGPGVKVALMWHGVPSPEVADAVCRTGLSSRVSGNDQGFFGKGVYLTPEAEYAAFYANGQQPPQRGKTYTLLLCAVCMANPYPLTRSVDYDGSGEAISKFHYNYGVDGTAKALYKGFDAHFVAIDTDDGWQAASTVADADYHELVVGSEDQVLPFAQVLVRVK